MRAPHRFLPFLRVSLQSTLSWSAPHMRSSSACTALRCETRSVSVRKESIMVCFDMRNSCGHGADPTSEYSLRINLGVYQSSESTLLTKGGREETRNAEPHFDTGDRELTEQPNPSISQRTTNFLQWTCSSYLAVGKDFHVYFQCWTSFHFVCVQRTK